MGALTGIQVASSFVLGSASPLDKKTMLTTVQRLALTFVQRWIGMLVYDTDLGVWKKLINNPNDDVTTEADWEDFGSATTMIVLSHAELLTLKASGDLIQGQKYKITDFATKYNQPVTGIVRTENIEPLIITALSNSVVDKEARSEQYPQDVIHYDIDNVLCEDGVTERKGHIYRRIDTVANISMPIDFRNYRMRRWRVGSSKIYNPGTRYRKGEVIRYSSTRTILVVVNVSGFIPDISRAYNKGVINNFVDTRYYTAFSADVNNYKYGIANADNLVIDVNDFVDSFVFSDRDSHEYNQYNCSDVNIDSSLEPFNNVFITKSSYTYSEIKIAKCDNTTFEWVSSLKMKKCSENIIKSINNTEIKEMSRSLIYGLSYSKMDFVLRSSFHTVSFSNIKRIENSNFFQCHYIEASHTSSVFCGRVNSLTSTGILSGILIYNAHNNYSSQISNLIIEGNFRNTNFSLLNSTYNWSYKFTKRIILRSDNSVIMSYLDNTNTVNFINPQI